MAMGLNPYLNVKVEHDTYTNARLNLSFRKPRSWEFSSIADFAALREKTVLYDSFEGDVHPLKDPANLPVFLLENDTHRDGYFAPCVGLYDEVGSLPIPLDRVNAHREMIDVFSDVHRNVQLHQDPRIIELNGASGTISQWSYTHEIEDGAARDLIVRSIVIFRGTHAHTYHLVDALDAPCIAREVWDDMIETISYGPLNPTET